MAQATVTKHGPNFQDLTEKRFGRWTVIEFAARTKQTFWSCQCDCGTRKVVNAGSLNSGRSTSCGCTQRTHGQHDTKEYKAWLTIIKRCHDASSHNFAYYGGRGITVCSRWRESFIAFFADMGKAPTAKHSVDRMDNNGPYSPGNCRWATAKEQGRNKRNNHFLTFQGQTLCFSEWAEKTGLDHRLISSRIRRGWTTKRTLTTMPN